MSSTLPSPYDEGPCSYKGNYGRGDGAVPRDPVLGVFKVANWFTTSYNRYIAKAPCWFNSIREPGCGSENLIYGCCEVDEMGFEPRGDSVDFFVECADGGNVAFREIPMTRIVATHRGWDWDCEGCQNGRPLPLRKVASGVAAWRGGFNH